MEATNSILFQNLHTSLLSLPSKLPHSLKLFSPSSLNLRISNSTLTFPLKPPSVRPCFELYCAAEAVATQEVPTPEAVVQPKRKLYVVNLPWSYSSDDVKNAFSECGTVKEVEIIRNKDGKNRGFAFVTMASGDDAQAAVDKFHSKEVGGRTIKVEFARRLKKPRPQPSVVLPTKETGHKLYVSNLQWKARSSHLREFFSANFNPVSARVVFENPSGRSAGYGFVSFSSKEEAEAAISSLDGKELLGRPVRLKFSERAGEGESANDEEVKDNHDEPVSELGEEIIEAEADKS